MREDIERVLITEQELRDKVAGMGAQISRMMLMWFSVSSP